MPESHPASVQVRDLTKRYGAVEAVRGVSFEVGKGEILGLLGRNGAGKTSTLECLLGLRRSDGGSVTIEGIDAFAEPEKAKAIVGAQLQAATLQDKITPRQALRFFGSFYGRPVPAGRLIERFSLTSKADAPFDSLSGGQKQRLFLALAFVHQPRVVVLDEPTAGLDPQARRELHATVRELRGAGVTILLSTHHLDEAEQLCDRVGILDAGRLIASGTPDELRARAKVKSRLIIRTGEPIDASAVPGLPPGLNSVPGDRSWVVETPDINAAIIAVVQHLSATQNQLLDLQIRRPTLEDAFIELTGSKWDGET